MTGKHYYSAGILLAAAALAATAVAYPHLPDTVPTHWSIHGRPDGYGPKWELYIFGAGPIAAIVLLTWVLPLFSPQRFESDRFRSAYLDVMLIVAGLFGYFDALILWTSLGRSLRIGRAVLLGFCVFFVLMGNVMGKIRRNSFIGVKTPWSLASERVWNATQRVAAKSLVISGLAGVALIAIGASFWASFAVLLAGALTPVMYSLYFYQQLQRHGEL